MKVVFNLSQQRPNIFLLGDLEAGNTFRYASDKDTTVRMVVKRNDNATSNVFDIEEGTIDSCMHTKQIYLIEGVFVVSKILKEK